MTGWQPIETAPKDGTYVLLWVMGYRYAELSRVMVGRAPYVGKHWRSHPGQYEVGASHWMPLPEAPK